MLYLERDFLKPKNCTSRNWWVQLGVWKAARFCSFGIGFGLLSPWSQRNGGDFSSGISISEWNICNEQRLEDDSTLAWIIFCVEVSVSDEKLHHTLLKKCILTWNVFIQIQTHTKRSGVWFFVHARRKSVIAGLADNGVFQNELRKFHGDRYVGWIPCLAFRVVWASLLASPACATQR